MTNTFIAMFDLAVETENEDEERWAYRKMKNAYRELMGDTQGLLQAMCWASDLRGARARAADASS